MVMKTETITVITAAVAICAAADTTSASYCGSACAMIAGIDTEAGETELKEMLTNPGS